MENKFYTSNVGDLKNLAFYIDDEIIKDFPDFHYGRLKLTRPEDSTTRICKKNDRLDIHTSDGDSFSLPYCYQNLFLILKRCTNPIPNEVNVSFENFLKYGVQAEKKLFSNVSLSKNESLKKLWDGVIKKINLISAESHSLRDLMDRILNLPFLQGFLSSLVIVHLKGQTTAKLIGSVWRGDLVQGSIRVKEFNSFFNSVKKSKIKSFLSESFPQLNLPFNGSFLAKEVTSKKFSLVAIASRHDFLFYNSSEIELFESCIALLRPHFDRLIEQEFLDKRISELVGCLKEFPLPLRVREVESGVAFTNNAFKAELKDGDIFFKKKIKDTFSLDIFESDDFKHYAFDLFHFQRISLLGELLNTLRHELSNPLFGLKLGAELFRMSDKLVEQKDIMLEIEKNIIRCQAIIENFSHLYQSETQSRPTLLKKIINESFTLSKSEIREIMIEIDYQDDTENYLLDVPTIFIIQILFNLIINAAQAMRNISCKKKLTLIAHQSVDSIFIDVIDNGPGVEPDKICHLFEPFFTTKPQGTGLGLILSRNLAIKMGGHLQYLENTKRKGAHFRLSIPRQ